MFILLGSISVLIVTVIQLLVFTHKKTVAHFIGRFIKNEFVVNAISFAVMKYILNYEFVFFIESYTTADFVKYFVLSLFVGLMFIFICAFYDDRLGYVRSDKKQRHSARFVKVLASFFAMLGSAFYFGTIWGKNSFGDVTADQLIVNLTSPAEGTDSAAYIDAIEKPVFQMLLVTILFTLFVFSRFNIVYKSKEKVKVIFNDFWKRVVSLVLSLAMLIGGGIYIFNEFELKALYYAYVLESDLIDSNYADPKEVKMTFPEKPRNLIHIYLESMENSYLSKELGGNCEENLMPQLTKLADEGIVFSNTSGKFGGPLQAAGTQWSVASMVNMTTGLPMKVPDKQNRYGSPDSFLPGAYSMGDILKEQGYEQTIMFGANADFGGLTYYYTLHGEYNIFDYKYAKENGYIPKDYKVFWGYEDDKLYDFAKEEITRMYKTGKPFNFAMETADTHRPHGYLSPKAPKLYSDQYSNVIAYSESEAVKFVRWIQEQPFYDNTTIVIIGDHLSMNTDFFEDFSEDYLRTQFNLIINPAPNVAETDEQRFINRQYANFDMFPTIMASMGIEIQGDMLGIGTNLFSDKQTIIEQYGIDKVNDELNKKSVLYNEKILAGQRLPSSKEMHLVTTTKGSEESTTKTVTKK